MPNPPTILDQAEAVFARERAAYGDHLLLCTKIASHLTSYLLGKLDHDAHIAAHDVPALMILVELCCEQVQHSHDRLVRIATWTRCLEELHQPVELPAAPRPNVEDNGRLL